MMSLAGAGLGLIAATAASDSSGGDSPVPPSKQAPVFISGSGEAVVEVSVNEGETAVYTAEATDADSDTLTYSLRGTDAALFNLDANTGELTFIDAPDHDSLGSNHPYDVTIVAMDSDGLSVNQNIIITVNDVNGELAFTSGTAMALDFTQLSDNRITDVEAIDLRNDGGDSSLTLNLSDVLNLNGSSNSLTIYGSDGDSVALLKGPSGQQGGRWERSDSELDAWVFRADNGYGSSHGGEVVASIFVDSSVDMTVYPFS